MIFDKVYDKYQDEMLTYGFFNIKGGKSSDFKAFIANTVFYIEGNGWVINSESLNLNENTMLNPEVKKAMFKHKCNASNIRFVYEDGRTRFLFNFLNDKEKYEICIFEAYKRKINIG